ncbi:MAG: hypothetical protein JST19_13445 [Bacteroidetes bacterium]|nr:hypothetical protein [Bacteroidota bacterium]
MFKKITSNRDPKDTVFSEIKKEFRPYFSKTGTFLKHCAERYPVFLFWMMVINITLSVILVSTVFRRKDEPVKKPAIKVSPISDGFDQIVAAGHRLKITLDLKRQVDSLAHLKQLTAADSAALLKDLDSIQHLQIHLNPKK